MSQQSNVIGNRPTDAAEVTMPELHRLVQSHIELISRTALNNMATGPSLMDPNPLTTGLGEYLLLVSQFWADLTKSILESPAIHQAAVDVHEESRRRSHLTDLSSVVNMDLEIMKLSAIRDLTKKHSLAVQDVWGVQSPRDLAQSDSQVASAVIEEIDTIVRKHLHIGVANGP
ncbi:hypothetical protein V2G26_015060 [Clonostachys chloroleuca]|uniref:Uncharacterized protein n=1 Tax=Clonostachys chloroleuca TaxID=1926264 RepID=A0AA35MCC8_9HYPO|nr:unnamed protein product [Clonostachys chloroleuca]